MATICSSCGTPAASEDARHCHQCGAPLHPEGTPPVGEADRNVSGGMVESADATERPILAAESRNWAMAAHLVAIVSAWFSLGFVGPLVVWLVKREEDPFVEFHAREALNFNLTVLIYFWVSVVLAFLLVGLVLLPILGVFYLIAVVLGGVRASNGQYFRYPLSIRFVS